MPDGNFGRPLFRFYAPRLRMVFQRLLRDNGAMRRIVTLVVFAFVVLAVAEDNRFTVLSDWRNHNQRWVQRQEGSYMLYRRLNEISFGQLDQRDQEVATIHTAAGWRQRRQYVQETLHKLLGPWPERSPLNARVVGTLQRDGYRVEKVVFESQPGFPVTAALYVPDATEARPGILYIPGHYEAGFRAAHYQNACLNLVNKGFVVLAYDPIGQGERHQEIDATTGEVFVSTREVPHYKMHSYVGNQLFLSGVSLARYFTWDAIRAIDYLASRPEVDPDRIGVTGNSGGGNLTVNTAAMDERVKVAVPSCFVTSYRRMLSLNGIQDAEQNVYHALVHGIEHADWLLAFAPKPLLMLTTTHDFFPIQGARETEAVMQAVYRELDAPDRFARAEDDHGHGYTRQNSEASYAFFQKHLALPGDATERSFPAFTEAELKVTETGQVATALKAETVFSLHQPEAASQLRRIEASRDEAGHPAKVVAAARKLSGYRSPSAHDDAVFRGGYAMGSYRIEKYALDGGPNAVVPLLLALPANQAPHAAVVYLHPQGKQSAIGEGGTFETLTARGYAVIAPDVIGTGETAPAIGRANDHNAPFYQGAISATSVVGLQAEDVTRIVSWLQGDPRIRATNIGLVAHGSMGPTGIHAAAFHPEIRWLLLDESLATYASIVTNRFYTTPTAAMVPGALSAYDLPDLIASIAPRRVAIRAPRDQRDEALSAEEAEGVFRFVTSTFRAADADDRLRIDAGATAVADLADWCAR
jgi:cephalosporin-C deacetylase-like acetyl esterase